MCIHAVTTDSSAQLFDHVFDVTGINIVIDL